MEYIIEGYVARDKGGSLYWHHEKPKRFNEDGMAWWVSEDSICKIPLNLGIFFDLKWEDEPIPVTMKFEEKNDMTVEN